MRSSQHEAMNLGQCGSGGDVYARVRIVGHGHGAVSPRGLCCLVVSYWHFWSLVCAQLNDVRDVNWVEAI